MRINWRNLAILILLLIMLVVFYAKPILVAEFLIPDHYDQSIRPDDAYPFVFVLLGLILGFVFVLLDQRDSR